MNTVIAEMLIVATLSSLCRGELERCLICFDRTARFGCVYVIHSGQCPLVYQMEPPATLECSPYDNTSPDQAFRLKLVCTVTSNNELISHYGIDSFDLSWYRRRCSDAQVENLGSGDNKQEFGSGSTQKMFLSGIAGLSLAPFSEEMPGEYWCQAVVTNSSGQYLTIESNVLTVFRPEHYAGLDVCDIALSVGSQKCAAITSNSSPSLPQASPSCLMPVQVKESVSSYFTVPSPTAEVEATQIQMVTSINEPG